MFREKIDISEHWIEGIPDKLTLNCAECGNKPNFDYRVKDEMWSKVIEGGNQRGVVCLNCFDKLAEKKGIDVGDYLEVVFYLGEGKTIELKPIKEYTFKKKVKCQIQGANP